MKWVTRNINFTLQGLPEYIVSHQKPVVSVSGGADSDILVDLVAEADKLKKCLYVHFDTGMNYRCMYEHLHSLEQRYGIRINIIRSPKGVVDCIHEYGVPVFSKALSKIISHAQKNGFDFRSAFLMPKYIRRWWENGYRNHNFNVSRFPQMKEYLQCYPPTFKISEKCCYHNKDLVGNKFISRYGGDLSIIGLRKVEGDQRQNLTRKLIDRDVLDWDVYYPLLYWSDEECRIYRRENNILNPIKQVLGVNASTCCGCPLSGGWDNLELIKNAEPRIYTMARELFSEAHAWMQGYRDFRKHQNTPASFSGFVDDVSDDDCPF